MFTALDRNHLFREPNFLPVLFLPDIFFSSSSSALIRLVGMRFGALGKVDEGALPRKGEINDGSFLPLSLSPSPSLSLLSLSFLPLPPPLCNTFEYSMRRRNWDTCADDDRFGSEHAMI